MSKNFILAAALACACSLTSAAQQVYLCVDSLLSRVAEHNSDVRASRSQWLAAKQGIEVAKDARLPEINASLTLNYIGDGTILDRNFSHAMRDKLPHFGNALSISLYQPIYQGGAITAGIDMARHQSRLAEIGVKQQTDASAIEALNKYFSLMQMMNLRQVYQDNIALTQQLIADISQRHQQGVALKNDITRYELRLSSLNYDLQAVENNISILNNDLASILGMDASTTIIPSFSETLPTEAAENEAYWQQLTQFESSDLKAIDVMGHVAQTDLRLTRAQRLPSVGLIAADNLTGPVTFEIPAINKNYNAWIIGVTVKYNISSLYTTSKKERQKRLQIAHIDDQRIALSDALQRHVHQGYIDMEQAREMLLTEQKNVELANENYQIVETRFNNGMALLTDMLDASTAKLDSEIRLVNANISLVRAFYQLKFISGTL